MSSGSRNDKNKKVKNLNTQKVSNNLSKSSSPDDGDNEGDDDDDKDDKCGCEDDVVTFRSPGLDPRFQQQNQTLRCFVMYKDFFQCEHLLGEGAEACTWFKEVYQSICPNAWIEHWDELREKNVMPFSDFSKSAYR